MSAILRACALLARSYDSGTEPNHATLAVEPATATEAAVDARREYDSMRRELAQTRELLEDVNVSEPTANWVKRRDAFLSRAPAQTAPRTTSLLCYEGDCAKMTGRARPCPVHDAPAQAVEPDEHCPVCKRVTNRVRAESAEATLAAVRECWLRHSDVCQVSFGDDIAREAMRGFNAVGDLLRARKGGGNG